MIYSESVLTNKLVSNVSTLTLMDFHALPYKHVSSLAIWHSKSIDHLKTDLVGLFVIFPTLEWYWYKYKSSFDLQLLLNAIWNMCSYPLMGITTHIFRAL